LALDESRADATDRHSPRVPDLRFIVPGANENRWSDLLATLVATDPLPMARLLGVAFDDVAREVVVPTGTGRRSDRLDLLLRRDGQNVGVIEAKLLSDLGPKQLDRYLAAFPGADVYRVLHLGRLPVNLRQSAPWASLTWEDVLVAYARSAHPWVSATAEAWIGQLDVLVPKVDAATVWNDVPDDAPGFELALRARIAWLSSRLDDWCELEHDIVPSSGWWQLGCPPMDGRTGRRPLPHRRDAGGADGLRVEAESSKALRLPPTGTGRPAGHAARKVRRPRRTSTGSCCTGCSRSTSSAMVVFPQMGASGSSPQRDRRTPLTSRTGRRSSTVERPGGSARGWGHEGRPRHRVLLVRCALPAAADEHARRD
jgi:hypothetical protein